MLYKCFRFVFFLFDAETIHNIVISLLSLKPVQWLFSFLYRYDDPKLERECFGLKFKNPIGLAAGFDKNGKAILGFAALGVGFMEVGTVTPRPQAGNKKPRIFRFPKDRAIVNWLGFNNDGVEKVVERVKKIRSKVHIPLGLNIGKQKETLLENAADDYIFCLEKAYSYFDFFVVNISSPNTPKLRDLQGEEYLSHLLSRIKNTLLDLSRRLNTKEKPLLIKLSPDRKPEEIAQVLHALKRQRVSGIVATNTTTDYSLLPAHGVQMGGISGGPLTEKSTNFLKDLKKLGALNMPVIGVGGIFSGKDVQDKFDAGATLIEVYTGLIYEGPSLIKSLKKKI